MYSLKIGRLNVLSFLVLWSFAMFLTGCEAPAIFQSKHPEAATVIESALEFAEKLGEGEAEQVLHLPDGSLQMIFDHKVFIIPASTVQQAEIAGVPIPADTVSK